MALNKEILVNALVFLERVPAVPTGKEAYAWVETHSAIANEVKALEEQADKENGK